MNWSVYSLQSTVVRNFHHWYKTVQLMQQKCYSKSKLGLILQTCGTWSYAIIIESFSIATGYYRAAQFTVLLSACEMQNAKCPTDKQPQCVQIYLYRHHKCSSSTLQINQLEKYCMILDRLWVRRSLPVRVKVHCKNRCFAAARSSKLYYSASALQMFSNTAEVCTDWQHHTSWNADMGEREGGFSFKAEV